MGNAGIIPQAKIRTIKMTLIIVVSKFGCTVQLLSLSFSLSLSISLSLSLSLSLLAGLSQYI